MIVLVDAERIKEDALKLQAALLRLYRYRVLRGGTPGQRQAADEFRETWLREERKRPAL